jgi:hypothetical protein
MGTGSRFNKTRPGSVGYKICPTNRLVGIKSYPDPPPKERKTHRVTGTHCHPYVEGYIYVT